MLVVGEAEDVAQDETEPAGDDGVRRACTVAHRTSTVVEAEVADDRAVEDDQGVGTGRVARVLCAVVRVEQHIGEGEQDRELFGETPGHDGVDRERPDGDVTARRSGGAEDAPRVVTRGSDERLHPLTGRWDDGEAVRPAACSELAVDLVEGSADGDVECARFGGHLAIGVDGHGEPVDHLGEGVLDERGDHLVVRLGVDVTLEHGERQAVEAQAPARGGGLSLEPFAHQRDGGDAGGFTCNGYPQHGGCAAASTAVAGHDSVDAVHRERCR